MRIVVTLLAVVLSWARCLTAGLSTLVTTTHEEQGAHEY
jgi:hypothetical protein